MCHAALAFVVAGIFNQSRVSGWPAALADAVKVKHGFYKWEVKSAVRFSYFLPRDLETISKIPPKFFLSYRTARGVANKFYK